jgi:hypothetical protein
MTKKKITWDDIPSVEGLEVDWDFKPETSLGKRAWMRMPKSDLLSILDMKSMPVQIVTKNFEGKGVLVDIAQRGLAVLLDTKLAVSEQVKIGLFLGKQKIMSRAVIRNVAEDRSRHRIGMEFLDIKKEYESFIAGLIATKGYGSLA